MAKGGLHFWHVVVIVLLAALIGTATGDVLLRALPGWRVAEFLGAGVPLGTSAPVSLDLRVVQLTLGGSIRFTVLGGILSALSLLVFIRRV
ncbi:MAG TPA: DUF4321 domain-containing protein [Patescibacteria group bacterium]|nr:DUF4321 domain-containing protein [Patescibacteria group bacterium]